MALCHDWQTTSKFQQATLSRNKANWKGRIKSIVPFRLSIIVTVRWVLTCWVPECSVYGNGLRAEFTYCFCIDIPSLNDSGCRKCIAERLLSRLSSILFKTRFGLFWIPALWFCLTFSVLDKSAHWCSQETWGLSCEQNLIPKWPTEVYRPPCYQILWRKTAW